VVNIIFEGVACDDCACWISNADDSGVDYYGDDYAAKWRAGIEANSIPNSAIACGGEEDGRRDFRCDNCGLSQHSFAHKLVGFDR
jgi:hypothetical protein